MRPAAGLLLLASALLLALVAGGPAALAAPSPEPAGRVTIVMGTVEAVAADGTVRTLGRQDPVFEGDTLRSGPGGRAQVRFTDRSLLSLRPDTELSIDDYEYDAAAPASGRQSLSVAAGGFRKLTGEVAERNREGYRVSTPLAVVGVRGTIWSGFQRRGGPFLLGVARGAIRAENPSGRVVELGEGAGFNYARFNPDGSVEFLIEPPVELEASPELGEGDGGGTGGGSEDSSVTTGGGQSESTAGTVQPEGTQPVATVSNPESGTVINQAQTGTGEVPTTEPVPIGDTVLTRAERDAFLASDLAIVGAGVTASDVGADGLPIEMPAGAGSGLGAFDADGVPIIVAGPDTAFPVGITSLSRSDALAGADQIFTPRSGAYETLLTDVDGVAGLTWGQFSAPITAFLDVNDATAIETVTDDFVLLALGSPRDIADLTGVARFESVQAEVRTSGFTVEDLFSEVFVDFDTGGVDGILDVVLSDPTDTEGQAFSYIVDFVGQFEAGYLVDSAITEGDFANSTTGEVFPMEGDIAGFLTGVDGDALQLSFGYTTSAETGADVAGLVLLRSGLTPPNALTPAEIDLLGQGIGAVVIECCFAEAGTALGFATDPRPSAGEDAILAFNRDGVGDPLSPLQADFTLFPPDTVVRRGDAPVKNFFDGFEVGGQLGTFEWQTSDASGNPAPILIYDSVTGESVGEVTGNNLLVLTGQLSDVATLTGTRRFTGNTLAQGFWVNSSAAQPLQGAEFSFNVDFATGDIFDGFGAVFTDPDDAGESLRDGFEVFFGGQVAIANDSPFVDFDLLGGFYYDLDGDNGGDGALDVANSEMQGFFAGDGNVFNLGFSFLSADPAAVGGQPPPGGETSPGSFIEPVNAVGAAILTFDDLSLTTAEATDLSESGRVFVGVDCCGPDTGVGFGVSGSPVADPNVDSDLASTILLGINTDANGEDLRPGDAGALDATPELLLRPGSAFGFVDPSFTEAVPPEIDLVAGVRFGSFTGSAGIIADAGTGFIADRLDPELFFLSGVPSDPVALQGLGALGFSTFAGSSDIDATNPNDPMGPTIQTLGGFANSNLIDIDPAASPFPGASLSFNTDLSTGEVLNGHLFGLTALDPLTGEEVGVELFFDGQLQYANGNTFIEAQIRDGVFDGRVPLDLQESDLTFFIAGDGDGMGLGYIALGAYSLKTEPVDGTGTPLVTSGTFSVGNSLLPETRLDLTQAQALNAGRIGIAAYSNVAFGTLAPDAFGASGLLLGRSSAPTAPGDDFLLGANSLFLDPATGDPVDTTRRGFFAQPYDFVLTRNTATSSLFDADVVPTGGTSFAGFEVSWGVWNGIPGDSGARIQDAPEASGFDVLIDRDVFFATVNPTPQSQLPVTGTFTYATAMGATAGTDFMGVGTGELLATSGSYLDLIDLSASFDIDFSSGDITNGQLQTSYEFSPGGDFVQWSATYDGFVNGAVTDLTLQTLQADLVSGGSVVDTYQGDFFESHISGALTGPAGERFVGGFSFLADDGGGPALFEAVNGVFVMDRTP